MFLNISNLPIDHSNISNISNMLQICNEHRFITNITINNWRVPFTVTKKRLCTALYDSHGNPLDSR